MRPINHRISVGRFTSMDAAAVATTTTHSVPASRVRRQAYTPGGLANLSSPSHRPYWRGGTMGQSWSNEDDPAAASTLFYTAADLRQTGDGRVYYDGEDDAAAVGAFDFLQKLFKSGKAPDGVAPPTELRRGTGGPGAKPLADTLGVETRWIKHELAPGLQVRLRRGTKVAIANVGTTDAPIWQISMGVRDPVTGAFDGAGVVPLLALAIKGGALAASRAAAKKIKEKSNRGEPLDNEATQTIRVPPGQRIELGRVDLLGSLCAQSDVDASGSCEDVQVGALMIDSDGRSIEI